MRSAGFLYQAPDGAPRLVARPAGGADRAAAGAPREAILEGFPSTERLIEMNRQAAAEAFSGYWPRMVLTLMASLMVAAFGGLLFLELYELDARLAGCAQW